MVVDFSRALPRFFKFYEGKRGKPLSDATRTAYARDLTDFFGGISPEVESIRSLNESHVSLYFGNLGRKGYSPASIRRFASTISRFFSFLGIEGVTYDSMLGAIDISKSNLPNEKSLPLNRMEFSDILDAVVEKHQDRPSSYYCRRDLFVLHLMYFGGITIPELSNLDEDNIKSTRRGIEVLVDSNTSLLRRKRSVEIIVTTLDSPILNYLSERVKFISSLLDRGIIKRNPPEALLINKYGKRFSERNLRKGVCSYLEEAEIDKSTQSFRLGHILDLVKEGIGIEIIARRLGISKTSLQDILIIFKGNGIFNQDKKVSVEEPSS